MSEFEKLYEEFHISTEHGETLKRLADLAPHNHSSGRIVVETVIVEHGERRIVKKEERSAKLV